jgi:hypothetical protein
MTFISRTFSGGQSDSCDWFVRSRQTCMRWAAMSSSGRIELGHVLGPMLCVLIWGTDAPWSENNRWTRHHGPVTCKFAAYRSYYHVAFWWQTDLRWCFSNLVPVGIMMCSCQLVKPLKAFVNPLLRWIGVYQSVFGGNLTYTELNPPQSPWNHYKPSHLQWEG